jgi:folate-dependent phosphoribosylglycinamide formyltransferase PurN
LSYVLDPNVKIIQVEDDKGRFLARAVLRLLEDESGRPQLFIERIYSSSEHEAIYDSLYEFAQRKAEAMGVRLYSHTLENDFEIEDAEPEVLESRGSRTGFVYSDAAGGIKYDGVFKIFGAFCLKRGRERARPLHPALAPRVKA